MNITNLIGVISSDYRAKQEFIEGYQSQYGDAPIPDKPAGVSYEDMKQSLNYRQQPKLSQETRDKIFCANLQALSNRSEDTPPQSIAPLDAQAIHNFYCSSLIETQSEVQSSFKVLTDLFSSGPNDPSDNRPPSNPKTSKLTELLFTDADVLFDVLS